MKKFQVGGKIALVTGGASGFGAAFCRQLAQKGASIVVTDINEAGAQAVADEICAAGGEAWAMPLDVTDDGAWTALAEELDGSNRRPSMVVNNAGVGAIGLSLDVPLKTWRKVHDVCFWGVVHGCLTFGRRWRDAGEVAMVINVASASAFMGLPQANAYAVAKAGVRALSHTLSCEIDPAQIRFTTVCPTGVSTGISAASEALGTAQPATMRRIRKLLEPRWRTPEQVAQAAIAGAVRGRPMVWVHWDAWGLDLLSRALPTQMTIALGRLMNRRLMNRRLIA
jgi:NAD(P)-dependent dehydrogenase (short-subunit alcohol dehydrogenase family)